MFGLKETCSCARSVGRQRSETHVVKSCFVCRAEIGRISWKKVLHLNRGALSRSDGNRALGLTAKPSAPLLPQLCPNVSCMNADPLMMLLHVVNICTECGAELNRKLWSDVLEEISEQIFANQSHRNVEPSAPEPPPQPAACKRAS